MFYQGEITLTLEVIESSESIMRSGDGDLKSYFLHFQAIVLTLVVHELDNQL